MIRLVALTIFACGLALFTLKDWYRGLCGLILLVGVVEHPDMPKSMLGVQGLNPWNILLLFVVCSWMLHRGEEDAEWDMPGLVQVLLAGYLIVILIGFFRLVSDMRGFIGYYEIFGTDSPTKLSVASEFLINTLKWIVPGILLFDGCRNKERFRLGLFCLLGIYFLLGLQIIRWMPLSSFLTGGELSARSLKILLNEVGFHRVNLSMMMAGGFWALLCMLPLVECGWSKLLILGSALTVFFALSLTAGRAGYGTWAVIGLAAGLFKWRKMLLLIPLLVLAVSFFVTGAAERFLQGMAISNELNVGEDKVSADYELSLEEANLYVVTAGRNIAWPLVIKKIEEAPILGYGREGMKQTGTAQELIQIYGESFPHPHNAYLECLLDNGLVGAFPVLAFYFLIVRYSLSLFRRSTSPVYQVGGGVCFFLVMALLVASVGSQSFYPREGSVGMWCAIGLMLRAYVQWIKDEDLPEKEPSETLLDRPQPAELFAPGD